MSRLGSPRRGLGTAVGSYSSYCSLQSRTCRLHPPSPPGPGSPVRVLMYWRGTRISDITSRSPSPPSTSEHFRWRRSMAELGHQGRSSLPPVYCSTMTRDHLEQAESENRRECFTTVRATTVVTSEHSRWRRSTAELRLQGRSSLPQHSRDHLNRKPEENVLPLSV